MKNKNIPLNSIALKPNTLSCISTGRKKMSKEKLIEAEKKFVEFVLRDLRPFSFINIPTIEFGKREIEKYWAIKRNPKLFLLN